MGNFIKKIINKFHNGRAITDGKPLFTFLAKYMKNDELKGQDKKQGFVENIKQNINNLDYKQAQQDFVDQFKTAYKNLEGIKNLNMEDLKNYKTLNGYQSFTQSTKRLETKLKAKQKLILYIFGGIFIWSFGSNLPYAYVMHQNNKMLHQNQLTIQMQQMELEKMRMQAQK